jgi:putative ATP-dependent endonuclease of the OLD family
VDEISGTHTAGPSNWYELAVRLDAIGSFFKALDIPAFAFFDQSNRKPEDLARIEASFTIAKEIPYTGAEVLMVEETPPDRQWQLLASLRAEDPNNRFGIPAERPEPAVLKDLTLATLKRLKGEGGAAQLVELCSTDELPPTIVTFLKRVYDRFPKPKRREIKPEEGAQQPRPEGTAANGPAPVTADANAAENNGGAPENA